jgi:ABC-type lipoprotein export system ATPase subunit
LDTWVLGCEFVVLLAPSGSGKSTLLNILGGPEAKSIPGE